MKKIITLCMTLALGVTMSFAGNPNEREATVIDKNSESITVVDSENGGVRVIKTRNASISIGDGVIYVSISTPKGEVNIIKKLR